MDRYRETGARAVVFRPGLACILALATTCAAASPAQAGSPDAGLHAGDKVRVTVFDHSDLSVDTVVTNAGRIVVPLVGSVQAAGLLPQQVARTVVNGLEKYLVSPSVDISVLTENTTAYYGGIANGPIALRPGETLVMAASDPKLPANADFRRVSLIRLGQTVGTYDVLALQTAGLAGPLLQANDVLSFTTKPVLVTVSGAVDAATSVYLGRDEPLGNALAAVKLAPDANVQRIAIQQGTTTVIAGRDAAVFAQPGQSGWNIVVPHAAKVTMLGLVNKGGTIALPGDQSLITALTAAGGASKGADQAHIVVLRPDGTEKGLYDVTKFGRFDGTSIDIKDNPTLDDGDVAYVPQVQPKSVLLNPKALLLAALYVAKVYLKIDIPPKP
jgi:polysaccharide export outer membrane protein